jgi:hypothetical protein
MGFSFLVSDFLYGIVEMSNKKSEIWFENENENENENEK